MAVNALHATVIKAARERLGGSTASLRRATAKTNRPYLREVLETAVALILPDWYLRVRPQLFLRYGQTSKVKLASSS